MDPEPKANDREPLTPKSSPGRSWSSTFPVSADCKTVEEMRLVNALCRFVELSARP
jgi:hypothetical protein